jgi:16S rRNA (guanine(966)-N(2))-methyltransferase RsmD
MRESVFARLTALEGVSFLDLFSGSGIIALEAASRGAAFVEAVESDPLKRAILLKNAALSPVRVNCRFIAAELYVKRAKKPFRYIFCDPPFSYRYKENLLSSIAESPLVDESTTLVIHLPRSEKVSPRGLGDADARFYGNSAVLFFHR